MGFKARTRSALRTVPGTDHVLRLVRRVAGTSPRAEAAQNASLRHLEGVVSDVLPALQEVQGPRLAAIQGRIDSLEAHLPGLLNTISSGHGVNRRLQRQMAELERREAEVSTAVVDQWSRLEVIRREVMYEMRYGGVPSPGGAVVARILDEDRLAEARANCLRINLGCGHLPLEGYINVDMRELPGVDIVAPVTQIPLDLGEVDEVFSAHLVEHFSQEEFTRQVLPYWVSLLKPGGVLRAVLPDAGAMLAGFTSGQIPYEDLRQVIFGGQEYEGDFHFNMYTTASIGELFEAAGLIDVSIEAEGRRNGACLEMQVAARRAK